MRSDITGAILAGGQSRRFGSNKAFALLNDQRLIERVATVLTNSFEKTFVLAKDVSLYSFLTSQGLSVVRDLNSHQHPLVGLESALSFAKTERVFVCACDMPFLTTKVIDLICNQSENTDAVVPIWKGVVQPLLGVYSKTCLPTIHDILTDRRKGLRHLVENVRSLLVAEENLTLSDVAAHPFFDVDTPQQYKEALNAWERIRC